jgi:SAM-dependent methyltransferase
VKSREKGRGRSRKRYAQIAAPGEYGAGRPDPVAYATSVGYAGEELQTVPVEAVMSLGCGNPVVRAGLLQGEIVLDLGCGGGLDAFLAARRVGPAGRVIGVDVTLEMVKRAKENAKKAKLENVEFKHAPIERLPLGDGSVDVIISNCVMNHCVDKLRAFQEVYRVLKVGGRMCISDLVISGAFAEATLKDEVWGEWLRAAQSKSDYLRAIEQAGFQEVAVEEEATFPMAENDERLKGRIVSLGLTARKQ